MAVLRYTAIVSTVKVFCCCDYWDISIMYQVTLNGTVLKVYFNPSTIRSIIVDNRVAYLLPSGCYTYDFSMAINSHVLCIAAEMSDVTISRM